MYPSPTELGTQANNFQLRVKSPCWLHFFILCGFASYELISIRRRTALGRARARDQGIKLGQQNFCEKNPMLSEQIKYDRTQGMSYTQLQEKYKLSRNSFKFRVFK